MKLLILWCSKRINRLIIQSKLHCIFQINPSLEAIFPGLQYIKQASLTGHSTTLKQKRSFQPWQGYKNPFLGVSALLHFRYWPKLQSCATSRNTNKITKWQNPNFGLNFVPPIFFISFTFTSKTLFQATILCNLQEN